MPRSPAGGSSHPRIRTQGLDGSSPSSSPKAVPSLPPPSPVGGARTLKLSRPPSTNTKRSPISRPSMIGTFPRNSSHDSLPVMLLSLCVMACILPLSHIGAPGRQFRSVCPPLLLPMLPCLLFSRIAIFSATLRHIDALSSTVMGHTTSHLRIAYVVPVAHDLVDICG